MDLIAIIALIPILALLVIVVLTQFIADARMTSCLSNMAAIGNGFRVWSLDHNGKYPMQLSTNSGGTREWLVKEQWFRQFQVISNELGTPRTLVCPADSRDNKKTAYRFGEALNNNNISYFIGMDAEKSDVYLLAGDRNIGCGSITENSIMVINNNKTCFWSNNIHYGKGNLSFGDGGVRKVENSQMIEMLKNIRIPQKLGLPD